MDELLLNLRTDYPKLRFNVGEAFSWSPKDGSVSYAGASGRPEVDCWSLLHEVSHGVLGHTGYHSDFELMGLEVAAWDKAEDLGNKYGIQIDSEHIQDCLDTYRDWLHRRSTCPACGTVSVQKDERTYACFNCHTTWQVSSSRFCRPYRRLAA